MSVFSYLGIVFFIVIVIWYTVLMIKVLCDYMPVIEDLMRIKKFSNVFFWMFFSSIVLSSFIIIIEFLFFCA